MRKMCPSCRGTGKREQKITGGGFKSENCIHCTNGVAPIEHITEITLKEALNEMGIYSLIKNTVKEILASTGSATDQPKKTENGTEKKNN